MITHPLDYELLIFDVDGTLRRCKAHSTPLYDAPCHADPGDWEVIPGVAEVLGQYDWTKTGFSCASNQAGIGLGYTTTVRVEEELYKTILALFPDWPHVSRRRRRRFPARGPVFRYAWQAPDASSADRKPSPWMLLDLVLAYDGRLDRTLYVGDSDIDTECAARAGVAFMAAGEFFHGEIRALNATRYDVPERRNP